jgi:hypothetical protein
MVSASCLNEAAPAGSLCADACATVLQRVPGSKSPATAVSCHPHSDFVPPTRFRPAHLMVSASCLIEAAPAGSLCENGCVTVLQRVPGSKSPVTGISRFAAVRATPVRRSGTYRRPYGRATLADTLLLLLSCGRFEMVGDRRAAGGHRSIQPSVYRLRDPSKFQACCARRRPRHC